MGFKDIAQGVVVIWEKHNTKILTAIGVAGAIATPILASRATLKAEKVVTEFKENQNTEENNASDHVEKKWYKDVATLKRVAKIYAVPFSTLVLTIASILYCDKLHIDKEAGLAALAYAWETRYKALEKKCVEKLGDEAIKDIKKELKKEQEEQKKTSEKSGKESSDKERMLKDFWVYDRITNQKFKTNMNRVIWVRCCVNEMLRKGTCIKWSHIINLLGGKVTKEGEKYGYDPLNEDFIEELDYNGSYFGMDAYWLDLDVDMAVIGESKTDKSILHGTQIPEIVVNIDPWELVPFRETA